MPTLAIIDGIRILMYLNDHPPPHFHVQAGEYRAKFEIATAEMMAGELDRRSYRKVVEWTEQHRTELMAAWEDCRAGMVPTKIE